MTDPKIKTKVVHSKTKPAYNVIGTTLGSKFKIARIPYLVDENLSEDWNNREMDEAKAHAEFISRCFNESERICSVLYGDNTLQQKWKAISVAMAEIPEDSQNRYFTDFKTDVDSRI